ncbi:hypothetical protein B0H16DRAFT_1470655 [Mycena metata]|uniref:Ribonuclease H1 N-terminal domain-containing protein n=1 Tax=Mycena metata TaxID=1033252 RepID=A0AAD7HTU8_9AGAR|nr:hypothetical protein B0H16DRAFT_1470655 [Mycena metata]
MSQQTANKTNSAEKEMEVLISRLTALSKLGLEMTRHCIDVTEAIPRVIRAQVDAQVDAILEGATNASGEDLSLLQFFSLKSSTVEPAGPTWYSTPAPTPAQMEARYPPGVNDDIPHYVVCIGRVPGLYTSSQDAEDQVCGVPDMSRRKKDTRAEALRWYREQHALGKTMRVSEVPPPTPGASSSRHYVTLGTVKFSVHID